MRARPAGPEAAKDTRAAEDARSARGALVEAGLSKAVAAALVAAAGPEAVVRQLGWLSRRRPSRSAAGMLRRAIEEDWPEPRVPTPPAADAPPGVAEFARHAYAGLAGSDGEPIALPLTSDLAASAPLVAALDLPPGQAAEVGRRFGRFVRDRVGERAGLRPATLAAAVRAHGDAFAGEVRRDRVEVTGVAQDARVAGDPGVERVERVEDLAALAEEAERMRRDRPEELAAFEAWRSDRRADLEARLADSRLGGRVLARFDDETSRLEALGTFLAERREGASGGRP